MAVIGETAVVRDAGERFLRIKDGPRGAPDESDRSILPHGDAVHLAELSREMHRVNLEQPGDGIHRGTVLRVV